MEQSGAFWAEVITAVVSPAAVVAGLVSGARDAATGNRSFDKGFNEGADSIIRGANRFGAEHGAIITTGLIGGAASAIGGWIVNESIAQIGCCPRHRAR
jgi:hypothetical protein